ncbi:MAG: circadian clock protein KaiC [Actinobacteria bacterium]|nr:circadian clock protein KaiC [Actinomycetota bacterium]MCA1720166.1 circadian clock protein KaiC [Actinomycetota bacterium]
MSSGTSVPKIETGIPGFDDVSMGGLPLRRATVVAGQAGSGKTVFAAHFLAEGVRRGQPGVFVSLEEPAADLRANMSTLGWDVATWEAAGDFAYVDASPLVRDDGDTASYNFDTLAAQIGHAVDATGADRLVLDSLNTVLAFEQNAAHARQRLSSLIRELRGMGLTIVLTVETPDDPGTTLSRYGLEEFVADGVILLRHIHEGVVRRRSLEVLKMRGAMHGKGDFGFSILPGKGLVVLPQPVIEDQEPAPPVRITTGNEGLDRMSAGGFFADSTVLVMGSTGTGKTLLATQFVAAGADAGERTMFFAYEESAGQVARHALAWGIDFAPHREADRLRIVARYPEGASLDDHLVELMDLIEDYRPQRIAIDSLTSLERVGSPTSYRRFLTGLTAYVKNNSIGTLLTKNSNTLLGGATTTESEIGTMSDGLVLLRYAEIEGRVERALTLLKLRGTRHDLDVRRYEISEDGLVLGESLWISR